MSWSHHHEGQRGTGRAVGSYLFNFHEAEDSIHGVKLLYHLVNVS